MTRRAADGRLSATAGALCAAADEVAPFRYAAEWDNVGLLAGRPEWPVRSVRLAIDLTDAVAQEALRKRVDGLVLYHPPILKGIRSVTPEADSPTSLLPDLLAARVSIVALHTALDAAPGGTNDVLLDMFEPVARRPLELQVDEGHLYKLVVFVPPAEVDQLREALSAAGAGVIGHYTECSFELAGRGTFRGDERSNPTVGRKLNLEHADEIRLEMAVPKSRLGEVVRALYANHSYEEPAIDWYPVHETPGRGRAGLGRVGELKQAQRGAALIARLAQRVDLSCAMVAGSLKRTFGSITAAAGSFGVHAFRDPDSLVITGEFKHHDALKLLRRGVTAVYLGHYASERQVLEGLRDQLAARLPKVRFALARAGRAPLAPLGLT